MTDALITDLSKIGALTVISRTSSNHYKGTTKPLPDIARELHVDAVIEGSVMRAGDRVRISAQLVRGATGSNLWAESYERDLKDILVLQGEVARAITEKVEVKVTPQERSRLGGRRQVNPEAYELCLRGRYSLNTGTAGEYNKALDYFKRAIETDPAHAPAYAGLADAYYEMSSVILLPEDAMPRARAAARKALEIDPDLAEAHVTLAVIISQYDWDWKGAGPAYRRAIELNPGNALAHARYGLYLNILGRLDESLVEYNLARKMDPLSASIGVLISYPYVFAPPERRRYDRALGILQEDLEMDPHYPDVHFILGLVYEKTGQIGRAIQEDQKAAEVSGEMSFYVGALGRIHAIAGDRDKAEEILDSLRKRSVREHISGYGIALIYAGLGDRDRAFEWLEKAVAERDELLTRARGDPQLDSLRDDPRFDALLRRMNLLP
jgi:tetratricopeptide (TPR) repeat protein